MCAKQHSPFVPAEAGTQGTRSAFTRVFNALCTRTYPSLGPRFRGDERRVLHELAKTDRALRRQEQRERLLDRAPQRLAIAFIARAPGRDAAELDRVHGACRNERDRRRDRRELRATASLQRGENAVHLPGPGRAGEDDQAVLAVGIDEEIDVARLVGHRDIALMRELGVETLRLAEDQARALLVPNDLGLVGIDRILVTEGWAYRHVATFDPRNRGARIGPEVAARDAVVLCCRCGSIVAQRAQRHAERLFEPYRGGKRERPPARKRLLQRRDADLGLIGQALPRDPPARQLLANQRCDRATLVIGQLR